ncbi:zinc ribbon domain-containing protein [Synechococcus sp. Nb3U1]|uniref:zinc ribbon domain-containing protein n=1 Tax=Synechococcus sp. Nb3U1 TaxID=1914529 RepID=UPI003FCE08A6
MVDKADVTLVEDLKVANMTRRCKPKTGEGGEFLPNGQSAKSGLNKSFADAGIAGFLNEILPYKAAKAGRLVAKVNPAGTSQHCAICLNRVPKELSDRWHNCPHCGVPKKSGPGTSAHSKTRRSKDWRSPPSTRWRKPAVGTT